MRSLRCGDSVIHYELKRSRRRKKTIGLSVSAAGVMVTAPVRLSRAAVEEALRAHSAWIFKQLHAQPPVTPQLFTDGQTLPYLGGRITLRVREGAGLARLAGDVLELPPGEGTRERVLAWYKERAQAHLASRVAHYCAALGLQARAVLVRDQRKRWGSCNAKGELRLNWRLMLMPPDLLDYVVAHEVAHLKHLNHSRAFWDCVGGLVPDYKARRLALRQQEHTFMLSLGSA